MARNLNAVARALPKTTNNPMGGFAGPPASSNNGISPLVASYAEWSTGRTGSMLPRDYGTFLAGSFGPLAPMLPMPIDQPPLDGDRPEPRRFTYPVSWNMPHGVPGDEGLKLATFNNLRVIADAYSVARACIETRIQEILGLEWDIVPTKDAEKKMRGDREARRQFDERREPIRKFWFKPDRGKYHNFESWLNAVLEEVFVVDALSLYIQPTRKKGKGPAGSDLGAVCLIAGDIVRPMLDLQGGIPQPPNVAYQVYQYGVPRVDLMTALNGEDVKDMQEGLKAEYRADQILYLPYIARSWTPYGFPPVERALIPITSGLQRQQYQLSYFSEGSVPGLFVSVGDPQATPNQCRELQDALNAMAGDPGFKHKIIVIPGGSKIDPMRPAPLADQFDEMIMSQVCMAFDVMPLELGLTPRASGMQSQGAANQMAKASSDINQRKALKPLLKWLKSSVFDYVIREVLGQSDMQWHWEGLDEGEDEAATIDVLINEVTHGLVSIDEARVLRGHQPWGIPMTSEPVYFTATGVTPLGSIDMATGAPVGAPPANALQAAAGVVPGAPPALGGPPAGSPAKPKDPKDPKGGGGGGAPTPAHAGAQAGAAAAQRAVVGQALPPHPKPLPKPVMAHQDPDDPRDRKPINKQVRVDPKGVEKGHPHPGQRYTHGWVPTAEGLMAGLKEHHPDVEVHLSGSGKHVKLGLIRTPESARGQGKADAAMRDLTEAADHHGLTLSLSPEPLVGDRKTSKTKLTAWYRRHGFGKNKDSEISGTMARTPVAAPAEPDGRELDSKMRDRARERAHQVLADVKEWAAVDSSDYHQRSELSRPIYNDYGVDLEDVESQGDVSPDDVTLDTLAAAVASHGDWTRWYGSRETRQSAYKLLGFTPGEVTSGDIHLEHRQTSWGGEGTPAGPKDWPNRELHAYLLLKGVQNGDEVPQLWRGVDLHGMPMPEEFKEGAVLDMPIASFADEQASVARYGTDVTFNLSYARAVRGGELEYNEEDEDWESPREYVSGGQLRITRISKLTPPELPDFPDYPDDDDPDFDDKMELYDEARAEYFDLESDELLPEYQQWENDRWLIELEQVGVYDPDTGVLTKALKQIPSYDWMFADPMRPRPEGVKPAVPVAKAIDVPAALRELDLARRRLNKGAGLGEWRREHVPAPIWTAFTADGDVDKARTLVKVEGQRQQRDRAVGGTQQHVVDTLHNLAQAVGDGLSPLTFVDSAVALLRDAIHQGLTAGVDAARATPVVKGHPHPGPVTKAAGDGPAWVDGLEGRFGLYAGSIPAAYETGYGLATIGASHDPDNIVVEWHPRPDCCDLCDLWSTMEWTVGTLPGWPGDGGFGPDAQVCEGGRNCRCVLRYKTVTPEQAATVADDAQALHTYRRSQGQDRHAQVTAEDIAAVKEAFGSDDPGALTVLLLRMASDRAEAQRPFLMRLVKDILTALTRGYAVLQAFLGKGFDPAEPRDHHGRWMRIAEMFQALTENHPELHFHQSSQRGHVYGYHGLDHDKQLTVSHYLKRLSEEEGYPLRLHWGAGAGGASRTREDELHTQRILDHFGFQRGAALEYEHKPTTAHPADGPLSPDDMERRYGEVVDDDNVGDIHIAAHTRGRVVLSTDDETGANGHLFADLTADEARQLAEDIHEMVGESEDFDPDEDPDTYANEPGDSHINDTSMSGKHTFASFDKDGNIYIGSDDEDPNGDTVYHQFDPEDATYLADRLETLADQAESEQEAFNAWWEDAGGMVGPGKTTIDMEDSDTASIEGEVRVPLNGEADDDLIAGLTVAQSTLAAGVPGHTGGVDEAPPIVSEHDGELYGIRVDAAGDVEITDLDDETFVWVPGSDVAAIIDKLRELRAGSDRHILKGAHTALAKGASDLSDPNPVDAEHVLNVMRQNFPESALGWVKDARWIGPVAIPQDRVDDDDVDSWAATHDQAKVRHFVKRIKAGDTPHPAIMVQEPGDTNVKVIDGHHRTLAYRKRGEAVPAYVGMVDTDGGPWDQTHSYQYHQGADPANKAAEHGHHVPGTPYEYRHGWIHAGGEHEFVRDDLDSSNEHLEHAFGEPALREGRTEVHPRSGWPIKVGRQTRLARPPEGQTEAPAEWVVDDHGELADGKLFPDKDVAREPLSHVYRAMSVSEWEQARERGFIQSDQRGTIVDWEGTNAGTDAATARSYIPGSGEPAVIVKIRVDPADGWFVIPHDDYVRTRSPIPLDRVQAVSGVMRNGVDPESRTGRRRLERAVPKTPPANKGAKPKAAGIAVRAADTGRVLMLQRALPEKDEDDPAGGTFEFPGGRLDDGETPWDAARREWSEETGCKMPKGKPAGAWESGNGVYNGFVWTIKHEADVPIFGDRDHAINPDDPDGDRTEAIVWWDPAHLSDNPAVRPELAATLDQVLPLLPRGKLDKCLTCGCDMPHNSHGDARHITIEELEAAAEAAGITVEEAARNLGHTLHHEQRVDKGHPHPGQRYRHGWVPVAGELAAEVGQASAGVKTKKKATEIVEEARALVRDAADDPGFDGKLSPETVDAVKGVFEGTHAGLTVKVSSIEPRYDGFNVNASIHDSTGERVGNARRIISRDRDGNLYAQHDMLSLGKDLRGQGFAQSFNAHMEDWYRESGIERIELHADIDVGGYAWARAGYTWRDGKVPDDVRNRLIGAMTNVRVSPHPDPGAYYIAAEEVDKDFQYVAYGPGRKRLSSHEYYDDAERAIADHASATSPISTSDAQSAKAVLARIDAGEHVTPFEISEIGRPANAGRDDTWIGKRALLDSDWHGVKWL